MKKPEEMRWDDPVTESQEKEMIEAATKALRELPGQLEGCETPLLTVDRRTRGLGFFGQSLSQFLELEGMSFRLRSQQGRCKQDKVESVRDEDLQNIIEAFQISPYDIRKLRKRFVVAQALRNLVNNPKVKEMIRVVDIGGKGGRAGSLWLTQKGLSDDRYRHIAEDHITPQLVTRHKVTTDDVEKARKLIEA